MRAAATERGGNLLRTVNQATEENWEACPHCQGEEEKQQRDEARRILSPEAPQQTWKAKPLAGPRLGEMQEGTEQRRGKVEKEAGFGQREKPQELEMTVETRDYLETQMTDRPGR